MQRRRLFSLTMLNNHCQSRGSLWLKSRDPHELPAVDPRWLSHPEDVAAFVEAYRRMRTPRIGCEMVTEVVSSIRTEVV